MSPAEDGSMRCTNCLGNHRASQCPWNKRFVDRLCEWVARRLA